MLQLQKPHKRFLPMPKRSLLMLKLPALLFGMILQACQVIPTTETTELVPMIPCSAVPIISFSASLDSSETIAQVRRNNAAWRAVCGAAQP
jgi:hypothetical protein